MHGTLASRFRPESTATRRYDESMSPQRIFLAVALPVGVFVALLLPSWTGYDEFAHYSRTVDIAGGSFFPVKNDQGTGSLSPAAYAEGTDLVILNYQAGNNPTNWAHVTDLTRGSAQPLEVVLNGAEPP